MYIHTHNIHTLDTVAVFACERKRERENGGSWARLCVLSLPLPLTVSLATRLRSDRGQANPACLSVDVRMIPLCCFSQPLLYTPQSRGKGSYQSSKLQFLINKLAKQFSPCLWFMSLGNYSLYYPYIVRIKWERRWIKDHCTISFFFFYKKIYRKIVNSTRVILLNFITNRLDITCVWRHFNGFRWWDMLDLSML